MSPPEVWGPAVWRLFHTLSERINENYYHVLSPQLFNFFVRICKFLPCPECSNDASNFLAKIKLSDMKNKNEFKNTFYLFHNWVNAKKRKPLYNYSNLEIYKNYRIVDVVNNFIANYHTKGNMKLLTESFQRQLIIKDFKKWITYSIKAFIPVINVPRQVPQVKNIVEEPVVTEEPLIEPVIEENIVENVVEEHVVEETVVETVVVEEPVVEETVVVEESVVEETVVVEESVVQDTVIEQPVVEQVVSEEPVIIEEAVVNEEELGLSM
jgi:ADP-glucose pyrophosphorylase